jgi:hypothetical protein
VTSGRPSIPAEIQRTLRREARFGCCKCGSPFFEYHHIRGYSVTGHIAAEMMLLCPTCHYLATAGALDEAAQRKLKAFPFNRLKGYAYGQLHTRRDVLLIDIGSNILAGPGYKLIVEETPLFSVRYGEQGELLVSLDAYDSSGTLTLSIVDNEWILGAESVKDFVAKPLWLRLSSPHLPQPLIIDGRDPFLVVRGALQFAGRGWDIGNLMLNASGAGYGFRGMGFFDSGFLFNRDGSLTIGSFDDPLHGKGVVVALEGGKSRAEWARKTLLHYRRWRRSESTPQ